MSDLDLRRAERARDLPAFKKELYRTPAEGIAAARVRLKEEFDFLTEMILAIDRMAPRCPCGEIGEPWCPKHLDAQDKLDAARATYEHSPNPTTAYLYARAHEAAGYPGTDLDRCWFPGCKKPPKYDYDLPMAFCPEHRNGDSTGC